MTMRRIFYKKINESLLKNEFRNRGDTPGVPHGAPAGTLMRSRGGAGVAGPRPLYRFSVSSEDSSPGFTLIEVVVAIGIFSLIFAVFIGIFSNFIFNQRRDIAEQNVMEEIRFILELFDREARTAYGSTYTLTDATGSSVMFRNQNGLCVTYRLNTGTKRLERAEQDISPSECALEDFTPAMYLPVTGQRMAITALRFDVRSSAQSDGQLTNQGFITVMMEAQTSNQTVAPVKIQSTVASRQVIPYAEE